MPTLREIVETHLRATGCDGLLNTEGDNCACKLGDLFPCDGPSFDSCIPGINDPHGAWEINVNFLLYPKE